MDFVKVVLGVSIVIAISAGGKYLNQKAAATAEEKVKKEGYTALAVILEEYKAGGQEPKEKDINLHLKAHFKRAAKVLPELEYIKHSAALKVRILNACKA